MKRNDSKIKQYRIAKGMSQSDMAEKMHISQSGYAKLENGQTKMDVERLVEISKILEIDLNELISGDDQVINFYNNSINNGYVENVFTGMKDNYEARIQHLEEEIKFLRDQLEKK